MNDSTPAPEIRPNDFLAIDHLLSDEERDIRDTVRAFVARPGRAVRRRLVRGGDDPARAGAGARQARRARACTSRATAAPAPSATAYGLACLELEAGDSGVRSLVSVQGSLAMFAIWRWGSEEQKQEWLPRMAAGEAIGCFGLTEPDAGSDPGSMRTRARRDGDDWILNGAKMWITNGSIADVAVVWARDRRRRPRLPRPDGHPGFTHPGHPQEAVAARLGHLRAAARRRAPARPTRCCPRSTSLRGPLSLPQRGPLRDRLGRRRRRPRLLRGRARLRQGADRSSTSRSPASRSSSRSWPTMALEVNRRTLLALHLGRHEGRGHAAARARQHGQARQRQRGARGRPHRPPGARRQRRSRSSTR